MQDAGVFKNVNYINDLLFNVINTDNYSTIMTNMNSKKLSKIAIELMYIILYMSYTYSLNLQDLFDGVKTFMNECFNIFNYRFLENCKNGNDYNVFTLPNERIDITAENISFDI